MQRVVPLVFFVIVFIQSPTKCVWAAVELVASGSVWKVWDREEAPPSGWQEVSFDDSAWRSLKAPFAMNVSAENASKQGLSLVEMQPTTYYRIAFHADRQGKDVIELALMVWLRKTAGHQKLASVHGHHPQKVSEFVESTIVAGTCRPDNHRVGAPRAG